MVAPLFAIWQFLVAVGPLLIAIATAIVGILKVLWEVAKITLLVTVVIAAVELLFDPRGKQRVGNLIYNLTSGAFGVAAKLLKELTPQLAQLVQSIADTIESDGPAIAAPLKAPAAKLAQDSFTAMVAAIEANPSYLIEDSEIVAASAIGEAFSLGVGSAAVTAAFESVLPERLNTFNAAGPLLAEMAGFKEIAAAVRDPLYENAFGKSLDYLYKSKFKPELPDEADAVTWHARRLLNDDKLRVLFNYSGLKAEYEEAFIASAYRAVQPRAVMTLLQDVDFPETPMRHLLEFAGWRDVDIDLVLPLMKLNSTKNVRQQYLSALERSVELGTDTPAALTRAMTDMQYSQDAQNWVQLTVAERKLEQLAQLYRKSVSESYKYGTITDAQYVPALEAIGIDAADAQAHYAIDSIAKQGKILQAALRAEERLAAQQRSAAMKAAVAEYRAGTINSAALEAALLAAGIDPTIASFAVVVQTARTEGTLVMVYGVELGHAAAILLREKVAAYKEQAIKKLGNPATWLAELQALGIPDANARALVSEWEAQANKVALPV